MRNLPHTMLSLSLGFSLLCAQTTMSYADQIDQTHVENLQEKVTQSAQLYNDAQQHALDAQKQLDENTSRLDELQRELPHLKNQAATSIKLLYRFNQSGASLLDLLFSAKDFNDLVSMMQYLNIIQTKNNESLEKLVSTVHEVQTIQTRLENEKRERDIAEKQAKDALEQAVATRDKAQELLNARLAQEAEAARLAEEAAKQSQGNSFTTASGNTIQVEVSPRALDSVSMSQPRNEFVNMWAERINAYLKGSPLHGYGKTFAEAAWDNGVDPRWSPAISCVESSKGAVCFKPYNAWGWGNTSWNDWDAAIKAHVAGLAKGYGSVPTPSAAKKYCPPNANFWYATCVSEMNKI